MHSVLTSASVCLKFFLDKRMYKNKRLPDLLIINQRFSKRLPLMHVLPRHFKCFFKLRSASHRDEKSLTSEIVHQELESSVNSLFSSKHGVSGQSDVIEEKLRSIRAGSSYFLQKLS